MSAVVVDIVYVPLETSLLAAARRRGNTAVDGLGMLLHQGRPGFEAWFGTPVRVTRELRAAVLTSLAPSLPSPRPLPDPPPHAGEAREGAERGGAGRGPR